MGLLGFGSQAHFIFLLKFQINMYYLTSTQIFCTKYLVLIYCNSYYFDLQCGSHHLWVNTNIPSNTETSKFRDLPELRPHLLGTKPWDFHPAFIFEVAGVDQDPKKARVLPLSTSKDALLDMVTTVYLLVARLPFNTLYILSSELPRLRTTANNPNAFLFHFTIIRKVKFHIFGHISIDNSKTFCS